MNLFFSNLTLIFSSIALLFSLTACGQKGPLYIQEDSEMPKVDYVFDKAKGNNKDASTTNETSDQTINETPSSNTDNTKP